MYEWGKGVPARPEFLSKMSWQKRWELVTGVRPPPMDERWSHLRGKGKKWAS